MWAEATRRQTVAKIGDKWDMEKTGKDGIHHMVPASTAA